MKRKSFKIKQVKTFSYLPIIFNVKKTFRLFILYFLSVVFVAIAFRCAGQFAPVGGPPDTTPPTIIESYPTPKTIGFNDHVIRLAFSEYMDKQSVNESVFLSPDLGELEFDWSGTDLDIKFSDSLRDSTTYVLTVGSDAKDLRAGNKMTESFSLAFSTGDHIDSGAIAGRIFDEKPQGVMLFAYLLDNRKGDTLNPVRCKPDYLTQTGKDGGFYLPYLRLGRYRLVAIRDEYKNLLYDPQTDQFGVPQNEYTITVTKNVIKDASIRMTTEDTAAPFLSSIRSIDQRHALLRFSETIDTVTLKVENIFIADTLTSVQLSVIDVSPSDSSSADALLLTSEQDSTKIYRISVVGVRDLKGNAMLRSSVKIDFEGSNQSDTMKPKITFLNISGEGSDMFPDDSIKMGFSEWIVRSKFEHGFSLKDSSKSAVKGELLWENSTHVTFVPQLPFKYKMQYTITIPLDSVIDIAGNRYHDSSKVVKFQIIDQDKLGYITGSVVDEQQTNGKIFLSLAPAGNNNRSQKRILATPGKFSFENLQEGRYLLSAFVDADSNATYSYGTLAPFQPSERFVFHADTLKVRARWTVEGVTIHLK